MSMIELNIEGMSCMHCVKTVTEALAAVKGVEEQPQVTLDPGAARVAGSASPEELIAAVKAAGYEASLKHAQ
jgi:copper chaperone CopZ